MPLVERRNDSSTSSPPLKRPAASTTIAPADSTLGATAIARPATLLTGVSAIAKKSTTVMTPRPRMIRCQYLFTMGMVLDSTASYSNAEETAYNLPVLAGQDRRHELTTRGRADY